MNVLLAAAIAVTLAAAPLAAQSHTHPVPPSRGAATVDADSVAEVFRVDGLRVDVAAPPPGSGVARASVVWADGGYATVVYGRPYARGRAIFGGLVAWDTVWAAGAHRSTELWTTVPLAVGPAPGVRLAPGGYSLFVTPREGGLWTLHLNRALGMHLADDYDPALDVATVDVAAVRLEAPSEALTYAFAPHGDGLSLRWAGTEVMLPMRRAAP